MSRVFDVTGVMEMKIGFDNDKYLQLQAEHITARRAQFGGKLYLEFGGKLFDDYHASRVLPGFQPDSKIRMLRTLKDDVEIVMAICAGDIEKNKMRGDLGISYDADVLRLIDVFRDLGFYVGSVVITQYAGQPAADAFIKRLSQLGVKSYKHYPIAGYPSDVAHIVSDEGLGRNDYIETSRPLIVVTAPGPGSGKMATCLSKEKENLLKKQRLQIEQQKKLIGEQDTEIRRLNDVVDEQVVRIAKSGDNIIQLENQVGNLLPKALYSDNVLDSVSCFTTTQIAKELGITAQELNRSLCALHIQYYQSGQYLLYADYAHMGLAKSRTRYSAFLDPKSDGRQEKMGRAYTHTYLVWTERGRKFIHDLAQRYLELCEVYS